MKNKSTNDTKLARKWACDERTIRRWRKDRAPLQDPGKMRAWLATRKHLPLGTAALLEAMRSTETATSHAVEDSKLPTGAAAALGRLASAEAGAFAAFCRATESGDLISIKARRDTWLKISENLRRFDLAIEEARRDSGQLVPKAEVEKALGTLAGLLRVISVQMAESLAPAMAAETDMIRCRILVRKCGYDVAILSYACLEALRVPLWMIEPFKADYVSNITISRPELDRVFKLIDDAMAERVKLVDAAEPHVEPPKQWEPPTAEEKESA